MIQILNLSSAILPNYNITPGLQIMQILLATGQPQNGVLGHDQAWFCCGRVMGINRVTSKIPAGLCRAGCEYANPHSAGFFRNRYLREKVRPYVCT